MFTLIASHTYGRTGLRATLSHVDHRTRPSTTTVVARSSSELIWGTTVLEAARDMLAELLAQVDEQLAQQCSESDLVF